MVKEDIEGLIVTKPIIEEKLMTIFYDKSRDQYTIRIPKNYVKTLNIDPKKHKFKFILTIPSVKSKDKKIKLKGELTDGS